MFFSGSRQDDAPADVLVPPMRELEENLVTVYINYGIDGMLERRLFSLFLTLDFLERRGTRRAGDPHLLFVVGRPADGAHPDNCRRTLEEHKQCGQQRLHNVEGSRTGDLTCLAVRVLCLPHDRIPQYGRDFDPVRWCVPG